MTQQDTLDDHKMGILSEHLDTVSKDIVYVPLNLGMRYVWIDRLCISQDSHDTWREQSQLMVSIDKNAHFTLARHNGNAHRGWSVIFGTKFSWPQMLAFPSSLDIQYPIIGIAKCALA